MKDKVIEVEFDKIVCEGKALGRKDGKVVFSYGVLPGERAKIVKRIEKRNYIEGDIVEVLYKSPFRIEPKEDHFFSCSPWQIISYDKQIEYKKKIILEGFYQSMKESLNIDEFFPANDIWGYRTKVEYSFLYDDKIYLAFHKRGGYSAKIKLLGGCGLINKKANDIALTIVDELNRKAFDYSILKSLVVRYSFTEDKVLTVLFIKNEKNPPDIKLSSSYHKGHINVYSIPQSSVSSVDKILSSVGSVELYEEIFGKKFYYSFDCFFQNNVYLFKKAIEIIKENTYGFKSALDLYCGVGIIGISISDSLDNLVMVESSKSSVRYALKNVSENIVKPKTEVLEMPSEDIESSIIEGRCVILDPPRAGMHKKLIKKILSVLPPRIIYLSCNSITQGRDLVWLREKYNITKIYGFDFYPNTPHVESLVILDKKGAI